MNRRLQNLRSQMKAGGISSLFVTSMSDIYYLTGFTGSTAFVFITPENAFFITDGRYTEQSAAEVSDDFETEIISDYRKALGEYAAKLQKIHVTYDCGLEWYEFLKENAEAEIESKGLITQLRMEKDEGELAKISEMFVCAGDAFSASIEYFRPGETELFWAANLEMNMRLKGAKMPSFETIIGSGPRGALPHGKASEKIVQQGEPVVVDFGSKKEYCSDVTRLVKTGPHAEADKVADIVYSALKKAMDRVKAGVTCKEIDAAAREYIAEKGYGDYFNHGLGHGVGIDVHEKPAFNMRDDTVLKENMVLTIEPGIYLPGNFGVRLEDTIVVKNDGCENLTAVFDKYVYEI